MSTSSAYAYRQPCRRPQCGRRAASPERWQRAAQRAVLEDVVIRQVNDSGLWIANSGTQKHVAYTVEVTGGFAYSCSCPAGENGDEVCKHRAAYYLFVGALHLDEIAEPGIQRATIAA